MKLKLAAFSKGAYVVGFERTHRMDEIFTCVYMQKFLSVITILYVVLSETSSESRRVDWNSVCEKRDKTASRSCMTLRVWSGFVVFIFLL